MSAGSFGTSYQKANALLKKVSKGIIQALVMLPFTDMYSCTRKEMTKKPPVVVLGDKNKVIIEALARAAAIYTLPIAIYTLTMSFCQNKMGITIFAKSLIELGQSCEPSCEIDINWLLPCGVTVRRGIMELCWSMRVEFKNDLQKIFK